ncbi:MAG: hypothetical protein J6M93_07470 [Succinivibrio sp.]|nr:hypothetical protein [Succinivibrio sp.]
MNQRIILGDAIELLEQIPSESVDLIVTDPPYNLRKNYKVTKDDMSFDEYLEFSRQWLTEAKRVLTPYGSIYIFMGMRYISYLFNILERELKMNFNSWIVWYYTQGIGKTKGFSPRHDDILFFTKHPSKYTFNLDSIRVPQKYYRSVNNMRGSNPGNVWEFSHMHYCNAKRQEHPTQKPEGLYERIILASSNAGDTVLDPFLGSGTLTHVCQHTDRNGIGIEINEQYVQMAKDRLAEKFTGFDSFDEKNLRCPNDLNDADFRIKYLENHIEWFLKNHENVAYRFFEEVKEKYFEKMQKDNQLWFFKKYASLAKKKS